jgi:enoyl-CoA hydratase/carnithine racemase
MRYLLTGDILNDEEALRIGLVQEVVPAERLKERAIELATAIASAAPIGVRHTLTVARKVHDEGLQSGLDAIGPLRTDILGTADAAEGLASFKEKRAGNYVGR